jgi:predicted nucleotide-binding protein
MRPTSIQLSPAEALPLIEDILAEGRELQTSISVMGSVLVDWADRVFIVLKTIDGVSSTLFNMLVVSDDVLKSGGREHDLQWRETMTKILDRLALQAKILRAKAGSTSSAAAPKGSKVFIGHGRNSDWLLLQSFLEKRLHLKTDDFDGVFAAGKTVVGRLTEMLDSAIFAFAVMTAEDAMTEAEIRARQNVVHEVGLFQGRLGFERTIVLMEDGCTSFSNIAGLIYIPFPKGGIASIFERIRGTLEDAGVVKAHMP